MKEVSIDCHLNFDLSNEKMDVCLKNDKAQDEILEQRKKKFLDIGKEITFTAFSKGTSWIRNDNFFMLIK